MGVYRGGLACQQDRRIVKGHPVTRGCSPPECGNSSLGMLVAAHKIPHTKFDTRTTDFL